MKKLLITFSLLVIPLISRAASLQYIPSTSTFFNYTENIASATFRGSLIAPNITSTGTLSLNGSTITGTRTDNSSTTYTGLNTFNGSTIIGTTTISGNLTLNSTNTFTGGNTFNSWIILNGTQTINGAVTDLSTKTFQGASLNGTKTDNSTTTYTAPQNYPFGINVPGSFSASSSSMSMSVPLVQSSSITVSSTTFGAQNGKTFGYVDATQFNGIGASSSCVFNRAGSILASNITVNGSTITLHPSSCKIFSMQLANGDGALIIANFLSATVTITGSNGSIVTSASPASNQVAVVKGANSHEINLRFGNAAASSFGSWAICYLGTTTE